MAKTNDCWGIEVGVSALKAIRLSKVAGEVSVTDYEIIPHKQVLTTPDLNVDEAIQLALDALNSKHDLSKSKVVVAVPGNKAFARFAKLPPVEPKKILDIVRFEAVQQIPFPIQQVEWDYQVFQQEDSPDVEVGIFAITKERVAAFLRNFRAVGIDVDEITLSPVSVFNAFANEGVADDPEQGTMIMDIGGLSTDLIIVERGTIWLRTLPVGGANFTEALSKAFKLSHRKAEKLKREAATSKYARQIFQAMRPVFSDLVQEVQKSLGYYQSLNRDSNVIRVIGLGSTFRLPGLTKFLKQQLQMDVSRAGKFEKIAVEGKREADFADNALNLATAYGLALQGLGEGKVNCNLLPSHLLQARMWRAKQPWFAAAAACLLVAAGVALFSLFETRSSWADRAEQTDQRFDSVVSEAQGFERQWNEIQGANDPRRRIENVRGILDYRNVWTGVLRDISQALRTYDLDPVLLEADYDAIDRLDPERKRRMFIESVRATYHPGGNGEASGIGDYRPAEEFWPSEENGQDEGEVPRYTIRVEGFVAGNESEVSRFITAGFIDWLERNTDRAGRPYTLEVPGDVLSVSERDMPDRGEAESPRRRTSTGRPPRNTAFPGRPGVGGTRDTPTPTREIDAPTNWDQIAEFLPESPTYRYLDQQPVQDFVVKWDVRLRPPEQARMTITAASPEQEQPTPEPEEGDAPDAEPTGGPAASGSDLAPPDDRQESRS
ncbi:MAG: type IV pilus assembly protein PilM [Phycisphaeraceae bacterium]